MFKYQYVENEATGERFWIERATLVNDEGPQVDGGDWYEIDLQPVDPDGTPLVGIDLIDYGHEVTITKGLDPNNRSVPAGRPGHMLANTAAAAIRRNTLVVPSERNAAFRLNLDLWEPDESDRLDIIRELWFDYSKTMTCMAETGRLDAEDERTARERIDRVMEEPLSDCKGEIQDMFLWLWSLWADSPDDIAAGDPRRMDLYRRVLGLEGRNTDGQSG